MRTGMWHPALPIGPHMLSEYEGPNMSQMWNEI